MTQKVRPVGTEMRCRSWRTEGLLRMLENTLNNGERPEELVVYGGTGKVARNWDCYHRIVELLKTLAEDETIVVQSGKPVAVLKTHTNAPRVLMANAHLVSHWATFDKFLMLENRGMMMNGMFTAGSWAYIGTQGILQGTYETFSACALRHFDGSLKGRIILTGGMGGMGGAQPLAAKLLGGVCLVAEVDQSRIERRIEGGYCDLIVKDPAEAMELAKEAAARGEALSIGVLGNAAEIHEQLLALKFHPDIVTDQTSAHDPLNGYVPAGYSLSEARVMRERDPQAYMEAAKRTIARHLQAMITFKDRGAKVFEYGNFLRYQAESYGVKRAGEIRGFVVEYIRPHFCQGRGPFRWVCLSGDADDLAKTDAAVCKEFPENKQMGNWVRMAQQHVPIQGLPARICWLAQGERARFGQVLNEMVQRGELKGPVAMSRDHLDTGSVTMPNRETEGMRDGSDGIADWPLLNALLNTSGGADLVAIHGSAGTSSGGWVSSGMTLIADGTLEAEERIMRCLTNDPAIGVARHVDAGYELAVETAQEYDIRIPMAKA